MARLDELAEGTIAYLAERYRVEALASDEDRCKDPEAKALASRVKERKGTEGLIFEPVL